MAIVNTNTPTDKLLPKLLIIEILASVIIDSLGSAEYRKYKV